MPVAVGDELLVHAGTAIANLGSAGGGYEVRRRVPRRRARPRARGRDPLDGRARPPLQADGGLRRATPTRSTSTAIDDLLPENVELVHGPGCPVCVMPMGRVDDGIAIARNEEVIFTCFGDMMRVPGSEQTFLDAKAEGADIRMVYSPLDALRIAKANPDRDVVFFAIGFETTAPSTALTLKRAKARGRPELPLHVQPRDDRAAAAGAARVARPAPRRLHRPGSRLDDRRRPAVRVHPGRLRQAARDLGLRAARHPAVDPDDPRSSSPTAAARSRTSTSASSPTRATSRR